MVHKWHKLVPLSLVRFCLHRILLSPLPLRTSETYANSKTAFCHVFVQTYFTDDRSEGKAACTIIITCTIQRDALRPSVSCSWSVCRVKYGCQRTKSHVMYFRTRSNCFTSDDVGSLRMHIHLTYNDQFNMDWRRREEEPGPATQAAGTEAPKFMGPYAHDMA